MADFVEVGKAEELQSGVMKEVVVQEHAILLVRIGDNYYAANNRCPHFNGKLSRGKLEGTVVTCPLHGSQFDLTDGRVIRWTNWPRPISKLSQVLKPPRPLPIYHTKVENGKIMLNI